MSGTEVFRFAKFRSGPWSRAVYHVTNALFLLLIWRHCQLCSTLSPTTMSASNPKGSLPASYRFKEVYVDIPPSPYHTPRASKLSIGPRAGSAIIPSVRLKENSNSTRVSMQQTPVSKRKLDNVPSVEIPIPSAKRTKLSSSATSLASLQSMIPAQNQENTAPGNVSSEFYCHQCNRKYDKEGSLLSLIYNSGVP